MSQPHTPTARTRITREPHLGTYDREVAYQILDAGFICHVGFIVEGQPFVIPTSFGRSGDNLYIHGSAASRMLKQMQNGVPVCVTVTLLDGLVLARSVFNHSMNYRSVMVLGSATAVSNPNEKLAALRILSEHIIPGRWQDARLPNDRELKATLVLKMPIEEFSAKVRSGPPVDDEEDYSFPTWAGVLPIRFDTRAAIPDPRLDSARELPGYVQKWITLPR